MTSAARLMAILIAATAIAALVAQGVVSAGLAGDASPLRVIWTMAAYFTVLVNLLVAFHFLRVSVQGRMGTAGWNGAMLVWIVTVGVTYHIALSGLWAPKGMAWWADQGLHTATPVLVVIWWLAFAPKSPLEWRHPWLWAILPLVYCVYALLRGVVTGAYAYPFIDLAALGPLRTALNVAGLTLGFVLGGYGLLVVARSLQGLARR